MAADERSEQHFKQMDNIEEFNDHLDMIPPPLAQDLSIVQVNINGEYNIEKFIDLVKEEPCLWNTAFIIMCTSQVHRIGNWLESRELIIARTKSIARHFLLNGNPPLNVKCKGFLITYIKCSVFKKWIMWQ